MVCVAVIILFLCGQGSNTESYFAPLGLDPCSNHERATDQMGQIQWQSVLQQNWSEFETQASPQLMYGQCMSML